MDCLKGNSLDQGHRDCCLRLATAAVSATGGPVGMAAHGITCTRSCRQIASLRAEGETQLGYCRCIPGVRPSATSGNFAAMVAFGNAVVRHRRWALHVPFLLNVAKHVGNMLQNQLCPVLVPGSVVIYRSFGSRALCSAAASVQVLASSRPAVGGNLLVVCICGLVASTCSTICKLRLKTAMRRERPWG